MKAWSERSSGERAGIVAGVAAVVIALLFGGWRMAAPPAPVAPVADAPVADVPAPVADATGTEAAPAATAAESAAATDDAPASSGGSTDEAAAPASDAPAAQDVAGAAEDPVAEATADATTDTAADPAADTSAASDTAPEAEAAEDSTATAPAPLAPEFDLVRVSRDGSAVIAGSATPGAMIRLLLDGAEIGTVPADAGGSFVALFNLAPSAAPRILTLVSVLPDGTELPAAGRIAISPTVAPALAALPAEPGAEATDTAAPAPEPAAEAPAALLVTDDGVRLLQSAGDLSPAMASNVTVDAITYTPEGAVQLAGRGTAGAVVRVYLNNAQVSDTLIGPEGGWSVTLDGIAPGLYTLRADQIGADGQVASRFETPFQRETEAALAAAAAVAAEAEAGADAAAPSAEATAPADSAPPDAAAATTSGPVSVTVQPGFTLWRIARENLGDGVLYVQVFEANKDQIRDPDLIYPGQVFAIPKAD